MEIGVFLIENYHGVHQLGPGAGLGSCRRPSRIVIKLILANRSWCTVCRGKLQNDEEKQLCVILLLFFHYKWWRMHLINNPTLGLKRQQLLIECIVVDAYWPLWGTPVHLISLDAIISSAHSCGSNEVDKIMQIKSFYATFDCYINNLVTLTVAWMYLPDRALFEYFGNC